MRVAVDARRLQDRPLGGVGRMLANLLPLLSDEVELVLLSDGRRRAAVGPWDQRHLRIPRGLPEPVWLNFAVARWLRRFSGVFYGAFNAVPLASRVPAVVTIHDLSFESHPEDFRTDKRIVWRAQALHAARSARVVTTTTAFVRNSLVQRYGLDPSRVLLTPPSVDPVFGPMRSGAFNVTLGRRRIEGPYVVALGGARRRGLPVAVAAWQRLRDAGCDWPLVVVGAEAPTPGPGIVYLGPLADVEWAAVLAGASVFCYPTRYEGFGMPALEAAASGTPVVCAGLAPLVEILGEAAEWCEDPGVEAVAAGLQRLSGNPERRHQLAVAGLAAAGSTTSWGDSAANLERAFHAAVNGW